MMRAYFFIFIFFVSSHSFAQYRSNPVYDPDVAGPEKISHSLLQQTAAVLAKRLERSGFKGAHIVYDRQKKQFHISSVELPGKEYLRELGEQKRSFFTGSSVWNL